jgi:DNA-binding beta-propeller fold protein YncE
MKRARLIAVAVAVVALPALYFSGRAVAWGAHGFLDSLEPGIAFTASTIPPSGPQAGDVNPYGVAIVPFADSGRLHRGDILVSNFNDAAGDQGTGSTIVSVSRLFMKPFPYFDANNPIGLTTALVALESGFVVVGSATRVDFPPPTPSSVSNGALTFLDSSANVVLTLTDSALLNGPWDATVDERDPDEPRLFVSNVLSGTVVRIRLRVHHKPKPTISVESITKIASGFLTRTDPGALVVGPTGLALDEDCRQLFVADTGNNRIQVIDANAHFDQGAGTTVFSGPPLAGPLGLVHVPGIDHLVAVNGDAVTTTPATPPNMAVEITEHGKLVATRQLDTSGTAGALFGIALTRFQGELSLVYVNDNENSVNVLKTR